MSCSLTDVLVVVVRKIGHCCHRTSLSYIFMKTWRISTKSKGERNYITEYVIPQNALVLNFRYL